MVNQSQYIKTIEGTITPYTVARRAKKAVISSKRFLQHIEFFHRDHFEDHYHRVPPPPELSHFIDFFWETDFDGLWTLYPGGFSDALFPNTGYTYLINLGTPFIMMVGDKAFDMKGDGFLPRHNNIECFHRQGNQLFGIKFRISPVLFEKNIDFSEYRKYIFPLSYLIDPSVVEKVKCAGIFKERVELLSAYFLSIVRKYEGSMKPIEVVANILYYAYDNNAFNCSIERLADQQGISVRTLNRYFERTTGISAKRAIQIMRIRKAAAHLANNPGNFSSAQYGYYDHSHFYKHLKSFLTGSTFSHLQPHLQQLLSGLHK